MGNNGSTCHGGVISRRDGSRAERSSTRGKRCGSYAPPGATTHPSRHRSSHNESPCKLQRAVPSALPTTTKSTQQRDTRSSSPVAPEVASTEVDEKLDASVVLHDALLLKCASEPSNDSLAEGVRAAEEGSAVTLDTNFSCPLVGPRNITTQFDQTSEMPESGLYIFGGDAGPCDELQQRQSSSAAELERKASFEGRVKRSITIVEEWLRTQETTMATT